MKQLRKEVLQEVVDQNSCKWEGRIENVGKGEGAGGSQMREVGASRNKNEMKRKRGAQG